MCTGVVPDGLPGSATYYIYMYVRVLDSWCKMQGSTKQLLVVPRVLEHVCGSKNVTTHLNYSRVSCKVEGSSSLRVKDVGINMLSQQHLLVNNSCIIIIQNDACAYLAHIGGKSACNCHLAWYKQRLWTTHLPLA